MDAGCWSEVDGFSGVSWLRKLRKDDMSIRRESRIELLEDCTLCSTRFGEGKGKVVSADSDHTDCSRSKSNQTRYRDSPSYCDAMADDYNDQCGM